MMHLDLAVNIVLATFQPLQLSMVTLYKPIIPSSPHSAWFLIDWGPSLEIEQLLIYVL
jgi:hypothetical protein